MSTARTMKDLMSDQNTIKRFLEELNKECKTDFTTSEAKAESVLFEPRFKNASTQTDYVPTKRLRRYEPIKLETIPEEEPSSKFIANPK